jgi:Asp-tRNA(Asn)/Glu-tRNA(Gln) amidotransferase A subunit family amidase
VTLPPALGTLGTPGTPGTPRTPLDRRAFVERLSHFGVGSTLLPGVLWAKLQAGAEITPATVAAAEEVAGVRFDDAERAMIVERLKGQAEQIAALHTVPLDNAVPPAVVFDPRPIGAAAAGPTRGKGGRMTRSRATLREAPGDNDLAFLPVTELSELVRRRKVTSARLTELYLARLGRFDPTLRCVVTLTAERARRQAKAADEEIARGRYRGPLHGIPWGAKDLLAVRGYPTTWGAAPYKTQTIDADATVVQRLDAAGAVLVAKLTLGELAMGDVWFGGTTKNPWRTDQGSSGSSAGPASATAAGLVGFSVGSETLGSISSPSTRCGVTGLRPTFGRVPRTGAMALSWTMDKLGPICRSAEDCALVLDAIHGPDERDASVRAAPFRWSAAVSPRALRVGYVKSAFERDEKDYPTKPFDLAALEVVRGLAGDLTPVDIPDLPYGAMRLILTAEAAAAFDELTRSERDAELTRQDVDAWPNTFRVARFIPAVDYINANRVRSLAIARWAELMKRVDVIVAPTGSAQLLATNLTGHPAVIVPSGFREDGTPVSITFLGGLFEEAKALAVANAYQRATAWHTRRPPALAE